MTGELPPPLSWRVWLLVPLTAVGLLGLAVPAWRAEIAPRLAAPPAGPAALEERLSYRDELLAVLARPDLDAERREAIRSVHQRLRRTMADRGGITRADWEQVQRTLDRWPPR